MRFALSLLSNPPTPRPPGPWEFKCGYQQPCSAPNVISAPRNAKQTGSERRKRPRPRQYFFAFSLPPVLSSQGRGGQRELFLEAIAAVLFLLQGPGEKLLLCPCASAGPAAPWHGTGTQRRGGMRRLEGDAGLQQPGNEVPQGRKGDGKGVSRSKGGKRAPGAKPLRSPVCAAPQPAVPAGPAVVPGIPKGSPSPCSPQMHTRSPQISHGTAQALLWVPFCPPRA